MDKTKVYSYNDNPTVLLSSKEDYSLAVMLMRDGDVCTASTLIAPSSELKPYACRFLDEKRIYCNEGYCSYPVPEDAGFAILSGMCEQCWIDSVKADLEEM
jgi:hypothetical protein